MLSLGKGQRKVCVHISYEGSNTVGMKVVGLLGTEGLNRERGWEYREEEGGV